MLETNEYTEEQVTRLKSLFEASQESVEQLRQASREQAKKAAGANMARRTGKPVGATVMTGAGVINTMAGANPIVSAGLPGDPEMDTEAP